MVDIVNNAPVNVNAIAQMPVLRLSKPQFEGE
jgi:hypothetical protein